MAFIRITGLRMGSNYPFALLQPGQAVMSHQDPGPANIVRFSTTLSESKSVEGLTTDAIINLNPWWAKARKPLMIIRQAYRNATDVR